MRQDSDTTQRTDSINVLGAEVDPIGRVDAEDWARWLLDSGQCPAGADSKDYKFALAQCGDTLAWAVASRNGWTWASDPSVGAGVRPPSRDALMELRVFGPRMEGLIWASRPGGELMGRRILDADPKSAEHQPIDRLMRFDQTDAGPAATGNEWFVRRESVGGRILVTPPGQRIRLRDYLEELPDTGQLRICATRFVEVE